MAQLTNCGNKRSLNEIQRLQFWKLSHLVRLCFIGAQIESADTETVTLHMTKRGASTACAPEL